MVLSIMKNKVEVKEEDSIPDFTENEKNRRLAELNSLNKSRMAIGLNVFLLTSIDAESSKKYLNGDITIEDLIKRFRHIKS